MSDDTSELLGLADGPVPFPADQRADVRASMLATAAHQRAGAEELLPLRPADGGPIRPSRPWRALAAVAACVVLALGAFVVVNDPPDSTSVPAVSPPIERPPTVAELCEQTRQAAIANGLIGDGLAADAIELRQLAEVLDELGRRDVIGEPDLFGLAARVRLLAAAVDEGAIDAIVNTRTRVAPGIAALFEPDGGCAG